MKNQLASSLFALLLLAGLQAHAETYRWVDGQGQVHFDTVRTRIPAEFRGRARMVTLVPHVAQPNAPTAPTAPTAPIGESALATSDPSEPLEPSPPAAPEAPMKSGKPQNAAPDSPSPAELLARCRSEFTDYCSREYWETRNSELARKLQQELQQNGTKGAEEYPLGRRVYLTQACRKLVENFPQKLDLMLPENRPDSCLERSRIVERAIERIAHALGETTGP